VDEFFEAALKYMSGGKIDPKAIRSASMRAQVIASMLSSGRYLFILDGLEVMQHQEGDQYGLIKSNDLRDFLNYFAAPDHESFCLITSRVPLLDLMEYTTYTHRDVNRLLLEDGIALLKVLGVKGNNEEIGKIVTDWDGHALTISLLGSYLAEHHDGDLSHLDNIPLPTENEDRYERVHRVLRRYDEHLNEPEREFLKLFSAFRTPVHEGAFEKVFEPLLKSAMPSQDIISRLLAYRLIRHDATSNTYTAHPLIRNHYLALLSKGEAQEKEAHEQIKDYYLSIAGDTPHNPTLEELRPLIEVVHHACQTGAYDEAWNIYNERISQGNRFLIIHQLGAYESAFSLLMEFFTDQDLLGTVKINDEHVKGILLGWIGHILNSIGRFSDAFDFNVRAAKAMESQKDWLNASMTYQNLAEQYISLGALDESAGAARQALDLARRAENKYYEKNSLSYQAWAEHLQGNIQKANSLFEQSEMLVNEEHPSLTHLYSTWGIFHADHLIQINLIDYAMQVTNANLEYSNTNHWIFIISQCHRVLGDLDAGPSTGSGRVPDQISAREHYDQALKIARGISVRNALIEALLGRGRWRAKYHENLTGFGNLSGLDQAFNDLNEALGYAVESEYRIYEADIRVALAWAHLANGEGGKAKSEAERALQMSKEMGYHWGQVDAEEVLGKIVD